MKVYAHGDEIQAARELWRSRNRKALPEIARQFGISYQAVRLVFVGKMRSAEHRVERELAKRGCPGFENSEVAAA